METHGGRDAGGVFFADGVHLCTLTLPAFVRYLLRVYLAFIAVAMAFRLLLLAVVLCSWKAQHPAPGDVLYALFIGWRFDTVMADYLLMLPFLLVGVAALLGDRSWPVRVAHLFLCAVAVPVMLMLAADIPYFLHFYARLNASALLWTDDGGYMYRMIAEEPRFLVYLLPFGLALWGLWRLLRRARDRYLLVLRTPTRRAKRWVRGLAFVLAGGLLFLGIRGRTDEKSPIQAGSAYFCEDPFLDQLGLNPAFTFATSVGRKLIEPRTNVRLVPADEAVRFAAAALHAAPGLLPSPIARPVVPDAPMDSLNVVVILMESMSTFKLGDYGGPQGLAPFLAGLKDRSLCLDRFYSAGIHTFNGIWSTIYSFPALYDQQPLEDWLDKRQAGIGSVLRAHGYTTAFFTTHDPEFDNMEGSLLAHGFDRVFSEDDYPQQWIASTNGVPDHRMFEYAVPQLTALARKAPFLSVFMTTSDHKPYLIPDDLPLTSPGTRVEDRIVSYADRSVQHFLELAAHEPWYRHTVFVVLGDHGINMGHTYDMPLSFHHVPLLIHTPGGQIAPGHVAMPCGQIDLAPTLLGLLHVPWTNTTLGIDVRHEQRPFMFFCADDRIGCLDSTHYFIHRPDGRETLYRYATLSTHDEAGQYPEKVTAMRTYAYAMMQTTQWLVDNDLLDGGRPARP